MTWIDKLAPKTAETVRSLMRERAKALQELDAGKITSSVAQRIVERCNREIERLVTA